MANETLRYDDAIVRKLVTAIVWGAVGTLVGLWCALHFDAAIFAFAGNAIFAAVYYSSQRLLEARSWPKLSQLHFWGWQAIIAAAAVTLSLACGRIHDPQFVELPDGGIASQVRVKLENESDETRHYSFALHQAIDARLRTDSLVFDVEPHRTIEVSLLVDAPRESYVNGNRGVTLRIADDRGFARMLEVTLFGPERAPR